jgi:NADPH-dependent glutamate synthase beta subunit-like oxidoreductase
VSLERSILSTDPNSGKRFEEQRCLEGGSKMMFDVFIVGGGFAGLSAAMQLARARRSVCVVDSGSPRNRFAATSHGFSDRTAHRRVK